MCENYVNETASKTDFLSFHFEFSSSKFPASECNSVWITGDKKATVVYS